MRYPTRKEKAQDKAEVEVIKSAQNPNGNREF
jgi:hypothetical protein